MRKTDAKLQRYSDKIATSKAQHYLWLMWAIGKDYDGYEDAKHLKKVIDELVELSLEVVKELKPIKKGKK